LTAGGEFVHRNLFGACERLGARVAFGGELDAGVAGTVRSGDRLGQETWLAVTGEFERRPKDLFFGIGNNGDAEETRYREQLARGAATLDTKRADAFHVRLAGVLTAFDFANSKEGPPIDMVYPPSMLTGTRSLYAEVELRYDTRRITSTLEQQGALVDAFGGRIYQFEAGNDYWRYGSKAIHFQPLGGHPTEGVRADRGGGRGCAA